MPQEDWAALAAHIGRTLAYAIERAGMTQAEVARAAGLNYSSLYRMLKGKALPSVSTLADLLRITHSRWRDLEE